MSAVDLSDAPLDLQLLSALPNLMILVDNSENMDAEVLSPEPDGFFQNQAYVFPDSAYVPQNDFALGADRDLSPDQRKDWRSQWNGYNHIFYDPRRSYYPWPDTDQYSFTQADLQQPLSNPVLTGNGASRLRLAEPYFTVVSNFEAIVVRNAHYFTIDDLNNNGRRDPGENIYLVSWVDDDGDGRLDVSDDPVADLRRYYRFEDDGDGLVEDNELIRVTEEAEAERVRPVFLNLRGERLRFKTDQEDLQNFANWVSYHRRRILLVKGLAARFISGIKEIHIGLHPLSGSPTPVQAVKLPDSNVIVVDDQDPGFSTQGAWVSVNGRHAWGGVSLYSEQEGAVAVFRPDLPVAGQYEVSAWWPCGVPDTGRVGIDISLDDGRDHIRQFPIHQSIDQFQSNLAQNCGQWVRLGAWDFEAGSESTVQMICPRDGLPVMADAVRFLKLGLNNEDFDHTDDLINQVYHLETAGAKSLRTTLDRIGRYFDRNQGSGLGISPLASEEEGGGCQRTLALIVSDGMWNGDFSGAGNADGGQGTPFADSWTDTLADVAMFYYNRDLAPDVPDELAAAGCDEVSRQHMSTYGIALGGRGEIDRSDIDGDGKEDDPGYAQDPCFRDPATPDPSWPRPEAGQITCIDDFWHAAINSRGVFADPDGQGDVQAAISRLPGAVHTGEVIGQLSFDKILLENQTVVYQTRYRSGAWTGDVLAFDITADADTVNTDPDQALWSAAGQLERLGVRPDSRRIITYGGRGSRPEGHPFRYADLSDLQKTLLGSDLKAGSASDRRASDLLDYLRGYADRSFRPREMLLGDIVNSVPLVIGNTLYVGANDGMLHAFDVNSGEERFAYIPHGVFNHLADLADFDYTSAHRFFVDGTPTAGEVLVDQFQRHTLLVGGYGKGGRGYFCLVVRQQARTQQGNEFGPYEETFNVDTLGEGASEQAFGQIVQWEYPRPDSAEDEMDNDGDGLPDELGEFDPDIGFSIGQGYAVNANVPADDQFRPVVIFSNGYNSSSGRAVLYVLDAVTGELFRKIDTGVGGDNGLSNPALIDVDFDRRIDYAYAGDLKGNLWKFDLTSGSPGQWGVAYGDDVNNDGVIDASRGDVPRPLFTATDQAITGRPDVILAQSACAPQAAGFMVVFGTGRYLGLSDRTDVSQQSIYGIWDYGDDSDDSEVLGNLTNRAAGTLSSGLHLVPQEIVEQTAVDGSVQRMLSGVFVDYSAVEDLQDGDGVNANDDGRDQQPNPIRDAGWFIDFPVAPHPDAEAGERVVGNVVIRGGKAVVISSVPETRPCRTGGGSWLYLVNSCFNPSSLTDFEESASQLKLQTALRFENRLGVQPIIFKENPLSSLDQLLVTNENGQIIKIPFPGETWGRVHWRQNIP